MYYLIRNNYCIKISEDKNDFIGIMQSGDKIQYNDTELTADEIFTIDENGIMIKK
jgi:hypothetical protein